MCFGDVFLGVTRQIKVPERVKVRRELVVYFMIVVLIINNFCVP
jgi:hypothetical protein